MVRLSHHLLSFLLFIDKPIKNHIPALRLKNKNKIWSKIYLFIILRNYKQYKSIITSEKLEFNFESVFFFITLSYGSKRWTTWDKHPTFYTYIYNCCTPNVPTAPAYNRSDECMHCVLSEVLPARVSFYTNATVLSVN